MMRVQGSTIGDREGLVPDYASEANFLMFGVTRVSYIRSRIL